MEFWKQNCNLWGENIIWLSALREKGAIAFEKTGFPNNKTEAWKFSYCNYNQFCNPQIDASEHHCRCENAEQCHCHQSASLSFPTYNIKFCNGKLHTEHFDFGDKITVKSLVEAIYDGEAKSYLNRNVEIEQLPYAALNTAYLEQGIMIVINKNYKADKPIYIKYHNHTNNNCWNNIRNIIILENNAEATIIEDYESEEESQYFNNIVNEIFIASNAHLKHYKLVHEGQKAHHIAFNGVTVKSYASYNSFCGYRECLLARNETEVKLQGRNAYAKVNGVYKINKNGIVDTTTNIRHLSPYTYSNQLVKGVIDGSGKGVFQGQIHIDSDAVQTEGYQLHKALLLSNSAEVDCKPELEIFADDVKCSHGATSGDLDKEQIFYMQSRGISENEARKILVNAYLNEVIECLEDESIKALFTNFSEN